MKPLFLASLLVASAPSPSLSLSDAVVVIKGRADTAEMHAVLFHNVPDMAAYMQGRADGLREAELVLRYFRAHETNDHHTGSPDPTAH